MIFLGIDPGLSGALAVLDGDTKEISFVDTPVVEIRVGKKVKHQQDAYAISSLLRSLCSDKDVMVTIEKVQAMPGCGRERWKAGNGRDLRFQLRAWIWHVAWHLSRSGDTAPTGASRHMEGRCNGWMH